MPLEFLLEVQIKPGAPSGEVWMKHEQKHAPIDLRGPQRTSRISRTSRTVRRPGIEPGSQEWESCMITTTPATLI